MVVKTVKQNCHRADACFVIICTENREYCFGNIANGKMVLNDWGKAVEKYQSITDLQRSAYKKRLV